MTASSTSSRVTTEDVQHVADLANLALTPEELPAMARNLDAVLGYIAQLNELDTAAIVPMAQVAEVLGMEPAQHGETLRRDQIRPSLDRALVMEEAPETNGQFFKVPKVIER